MRNKKEDRDKLQDRLDYMFPVTSCTHKVVFCPEAGCEGCEAEVHMLNCNCKREKKLPVIELKFLQAMQAHRPSKASMMISGVDKVESERQLKAVRREQIVEDRKEKQEKKWRKLGKSLRAIAYRFGGMSSGSQIPPSKKISVDALPRGVWSAIITFVFWKLFKGLK